MSWTTGNSRGFTLMELLVVLLIIGILSTVALRTIDTARDRSLFDQTAAEMEKIVKAIAGDPALVSEGRRTDFGFYGDMGRLPTDLRELVANINNSPRWRGPYLRQSVGGDSVGFLYDAWGNPYGYDPNTGLLNSLGNGKYPMTVRVIDSLPLLTRNSVSGNITDINGLPPGERAAMMQVRLYPASGGNQFVALVDQGGFYQFPDSIPIGTHRIVALSGTVDSIVRWVTVAPRSRTVIDFRFSRPFRNRLVMIGQPYLSPDSLSFSFDLINDGATDDTIAWFRLADIVPSDSIFLQQLAILSPGRPAQLDTLSPPLPGVGDTVIVTPVYPVAASRAQTVTMRFESFYKDEMAATGRAQVNGRRFALRFSDGSEITVQVPDLPGP